MSTSSVSELLAAVDTVAPLRHAADWDNVGLLAGQPHWPVSRVLVAIDLTDAVAAEALEREVDAVLLYHPPIFKGLKTITATSDAPTSRLPDLLAAQVSLLAVHTALDNAAGGTNDVLLDAFELGDRRPLTPIQATGRQYKLVVFVPPAEVAELRRRLSAAGAGVIGNYTECSYELAGRGTFRGNQASDPTVGEKLQFETVDETRLELVVPQARLTDVVATLYAHHSYEEPAFDLYPLTALAARGAIGAGRLGTLTAPTAGDTLLQQLSRVCDLRSAQVVGDLERPFSHVIAAAGAFGVDAFTDPEAFVITGEFKHHDALQLLKRGVTAIHVGHDATERPVLPVLVEKLQTDLPSVEFQLSTRDLSPYTPALSAP